MTDKVAYWLNIADDDISVAEDMYKTGHWLYVAFMCHQAIEKTLKAYWSAKCDEAPPYIHDLVRLLSGCGLTDEISEDYLSFIDVMKPMNIEARYPSYKESVSQRLNKDACRRIIDTTKELQQWIKDRL